MATHRDFDLKRFVASVPTASLFRFFEDLGAELPGGWTSLHGDALDMWLTEPNQGELRPVALEQMRRINDLAGRASGALIAARLRYEIAVDAKETQEALALRMFLDTPRAFDFAWARYLLYANVENLAEYYLPAGAVSLDIDRMTAFREGLRESFAARLKGRQLRIDPHDDDGELVIVVQRGHYLRTVSLFEDGSDDIAYRHFRPAVDDLIVYDPSTQILRVKTSSDAERRRYLWLFAHHLAGRAELYTTAINDRVYTLEPLQNGIFSFNGGESIIDIKLVRARVQLGPREYAEFVAQDVIAMLAARPQGISLRSGPLVQASLEFSFVHGPHFRRARCDIRPPTRGKIPENQYGVEIDAYLRAQGIKLR